MMRHLLVLLFATFAVARAEVLNNTLFSCSVNLPDSPGWQPADAPNTDEMTVLAARQHPQRQLVFGLNVLHRLPSNSLNNPATQTAIGERLRRFGYQFAGYSVVEVAGRKWLNFPVSSVNNGQVVKGIIRYTVGPEHVYGLSMLRSGGKEPLDDDEMVRASMSFRVEQSAAPGIVAATQPGVPPSLPDGKKTTAPVAATPAEPAKPASVQGEYLRYVALGAGALIVLFVLIKIIGGGGQPPPPTNPPRRL